MFVDMKKVLMASIQPELLNPGKFYVVVWNSNKSFEDYFPDKYL